MDLITLCIAIALIGVAIMNLIFMFKKSFAWGVGGFLLGIIFFPLFWYKYRPEGMGKYVAAYFMLLAPYFYFTA